MHDKKPSKGYCVCLQCSAHWEDRPGGFAEIGVFDEEGQFHPQCPQCGGLYWTWVRKTKGAPLA